MRRRGITGVAVGLLGVLLLAGGVCRYAASQRRWVQPVPVLMYHSISDEESPWAVHAPEFDQEIESLYEQGYQSILPSDLVAHQRWGKPLPRRAVIITFDDGFLDCVQTAEPILRKYGFRAVSYLITGLVADSPAERRTCDGKPCLTWPEVRAAHRRGTLAFGGHTRTHANLILCSDAGEIAGCYADLVHKGGFKPDAFCYPFGLYRLDQMATVRKAGFTSAVNCRGEVANTGKKLNLFEIPRISMYGGRHDVQVGMATDRTRGDALAGTCWMAGIDRLSAWPRISWESQRFDGGWLTTNAILIAGEHMMFVVDRPPSAQRRACFFELWDEHRVVRLFRGPLQPD